MHGLTSRQSAVLHLADRGLDDLVIAGELHVGISTVLGHWRAVYETLRVARGVQRRERAIFAWRRLGREVLDERWRRDDR